MKARGFNGIKKDENETKQNKTNVKPEKCNMKSANQTPGGCKFAPLVANPLWRADQPEHVACFGLSCHWSFRHVRAYYIVHAVVQPKLSLQRSISP